MSVETSKTQRRVGNISRGTRAGATIGERALARAAIAELRQISGQPHADHGANTGEEIQQREEQAQSMAADEYRAPDVTRAAAVAKSPPADPRLVPLNILLDDLRRRTRAYTRGFTREERSDIATDALLLLLDWTRQGSKAPIYLGPRGSAPLRRVWFDPDKRVTIRDGKSTRPAPSARAQDAMRAAILQAARRTNTDAETQFTAAARKRAAAIRKAAREQDGGRLRQLEAESAGADISADDSTSAISLAARALATYQEEAEFAPALPDTDAAELVQRAMLISLSAARAIIARGWRLTPKQAAVIWNVSDSRAANVISEGNRELLRRFPEPRELLDAIDAAAPAVRELLATRAHIALRALAAPRYWEDRPELLARAETAANEWRAAMGELPLERRAIELAAQRRGWLPENVTAAAYVARYLSALRQQATAGSSRRGPIPSRAPIGWTSSPVARIGTVAARRWRCRSTLTPHARRWTYGLEAATDREQRRIGEGQPIAPAAAAPRPAPRRQAAPAAPTPVARPVAQAMPGCRECLRHIPHGSHPILLAR